MPSTRTPASHDVDLRLVAWANQCSDSELVPMTDGSGFSRMPYATDWCEPDAMGRPLTATPPGGRWRIVAAVERS